MADVVEGRDSICHVIDCRCFTDPGKGSRYHLGMNPANLEATVNHELFPQFFRKLRQDICEKIEDAVGGSAPQRGMDLYIICYCRKGAHRSTAIATLTQHSMMHDNVMRDKYNLRMNPMRHMSKEAGIWDQDYCGECKACCARGWMRTESPRITRHCNAALLFKHLAKRRLLYCYHQRFDVVRSIIKHCHRQGSQVHDSL